MFKPNYQITPTILNSIAEIAEIKAVVERSRVLPLNEAQLKRQAIVRMAHTSTSIEGNTLAEFQVEKVFAGKEINADQKSIMEVKNYLSALRLVEDFTKSAKTISLEDVLKLHGLTMKGLLESLKVGHFRPGDVFIVDELGDGREKLRFQGPDAKKVPFLINKLLLWLTQADKENIHPIIRAGIFHSQFVHIHPFSDGNGRVTRLLTSLILYKANWDFRKIIVLEDYYNRDRQAYYNGLSLGWEAKFHEGADLTGWLEYFVTGFLVEARKVAEAISSIGYGRISEKGEQIFLDKDEVRIMDFLTTTGKVTSSDVMEILGLAKRTAQLKLKNLVDKRLIKQMGGGPSTYFVLVK